jgi:hypothetical protein
LRPRLEPTEAYEQSHRLKLYSTDVPHWGRDCESPAPRSHQWGHAGSPACFTELRPVLITSPEYQAACFTHLAREGRMTVTIGRGNCWLHSAARQSRGRLRRGRSRRRCRWGARLMTSIVVAGAGVEPCYPERVVGAQPGPTRRSALPAGLLASCRTHGETLRIGAYTRLASPDWRGSPSSWISAAVA